MNCSPLNKNIPACYRLPDMKLVRANFLWYTKQYDRLESLRNRCYENGVNMNYGERYRKFYWSY